MGCPKGLEPSASRVTTWRSNQLSYGHHIDRYVLKSREIILKLAELSKEKLVFYLFNNKEEFLFTLENRLKQHRYLFAHHISLADAAIFPFIRQFSRVQETWFKESHYPHLQSWLDNIIQSELFSSIMRDYPIWQETQTEMHFPENE